MISSIKYRNKLIYICTLRTATLIVSTLSLQWTAIKIYAVLQRVRVINYNTLSKNSEFCDEKCFTNLKKRGNIFIDFKSNTRKCFISKKVFSKKQIQKQN